MYHIEERVWKAMAAPYTWEAMVQVQLRWIRTYQYRWVGAHIVHPLSLTESQRRQGVTEAGYRLLTERWRVEQEARHVG